MNAITAKAALADLAAIRCACGAPKSRGRTFCRAHYYMLPLAHREALYRRLGDGYEEAYADSLELLKLTSPATKQEDASR